MRHVVQHTLASVAAGLFLAAGASAGGNLIVNGSFETGPALGGPFVDLPGGSTAIAGWVVGDFHIDYCSSGTFNVTDGQFAVDLDGSVNQQPRNGSIAQSFATVPGWQYLVSFDLSGNTAGLPQVKQAEVSAGNTAQVYSVDAGPIVAGSLPLSIAYQHETFAFTAVASTTTLTFRSLTVLTTVPGFGAVIDNVVVESIPPTWTDLGFALAGGSGPPRLDGVGPLLPGSPGALQLSGAAPSAPAVLFAAQTATPVPFKCGTLVPWPSPLIFMRSTNPSGASTLAWPSWPSGYSGITVVFQYAVKDLGAPCGVSLSNALRLDIP